MLAYSKDNLSCQLVSLVMNVLAGGFKVGQLPTSPFEGARHHSGSKPSASNSSGAPPGRGPFGTHPGVHMSTSMDTTNSNSAHQSANQSDQVGAFRGLASSASQKERDRSPRGRESPFETLKHQQQVRPCSTTS